MLMNGGLGRLHSPLARQLVAAALLGTTVFVLSILLIPNVRSWALRPDDQISAIQKELWFLTVLSGAMGTAMLLSIIFQELRS
jgi:Cu/Ag efflux pump CusA